MRRHLLPALVLSLTVFTCAGKKQKALVQPASVTVLVEGASEDRMEAIARLEGLAPPGAAVLEGKKNWKVTGLTLCNTQALGDPSVLETGPCSDIVLEEEA